MMRKVLFMTLTFIGMCTPAFARQNWVERFLNNYKAQPVTTTGPLTQDRLPALIRNGEIPLSVGDLINLTLENNLDIGVNRLNPLVSEYAIRTSYQPFEPTFAIDANFTSDASRSRTQLTGVDSVSQFVDNFNVGYFQTLQTGTDITGGIRVEPDGIQRRIQHLQSCVVQPDALLVHPTSAQRVWQVGQYARNPRRSEQQDDLRSAV